MFPDLFIYSPSLVLSYSLRVIMFVALCLITSLFTKETEVTFELKTAWANLGLQS